MAHTKSLSLGERNLLASVCLSFWVHVGMRFFGLRLFRIGLRLFRIGLRLFSI